jgi:hypothetical protein
VEQQFSYVREREKKLFLLLTYTDTNVHVAHNSYLTAQKYICEFSVEYFMSTPLLSRICLKMDCPIQHESAHTLCGIEKKTTRERLNRMKIYLSSVYGCEYKKFLFNDHKLNGLETPRINVFTSYF